MTLIHAARMDPLLPWVIEMDMAQKGNHHGGEDYGPGESALLIGSTIWSIGQLDGGSNWLLLSN